MKNTVIGAALLSLPLIVGGLVYANAQKPAEEKVQTADAHGYICPATGEELPCENCCPLARSK